MTIAQVDPALKAAAPAGERGLVADRITVPLAVAAIALAAVARLFIAQHQPLWLDEAWTGAIASQAHWADVWRQIYWDANAPLYYLFAHVWAGVAGLSNVALRFPSAVFGAAAGLVVALWPAEGLSRKARLTWAAMLALWIPGIWFSGDARCYALLLLLSAAQTIAFARLLQAPDLKRAAIWSGFAALAILTHYHALILAGVQGLAFLAWGRVRAARTWPAALIFLPAFAWLAIHAPRVIAFAQPGVAWYPRLRLAVLPRWSLEFLVGAWPVAAWLAAIAVAAWMLGYIPGARGEREEKPRTSALWVTAGASALGVAAVIVLGFIRPSFVERYQTPFEPGLMLGVVLIVQALARRWALVYAAVILCFAGAAMPWAWTQALHGWRWYNFEVASDVLMKSDPQRLVFFWDHPATPVEAPGQLDAVGGFFFRRAGRTISVDPGALKPGEEPNARLVAEARAPRTAILWMYDVGVIGTAARSHKPNLMALDPSLACRQLGSGSVGILACDRAMGGPPP